VGTKKIYTDDNVSFESGHPVQTRSEENGLNYFASFDEALQHSDDDPTVWKISIMVSPTESIRLVKQEGEWIYEPILKKLPPNSWSFNVEGIHCYSALEEIIKWYNKKIPQGIKVSFDLTVRRYNANQVDER